MDYKKLKPYERVDQEVRGNLIKSSNWNYNFNRISKVIDDNNEITESNFSNINSKTIPSELLDGLNNDSANTVFLQLLAIISKLSEKIDKNEFNSTNAINLSNVTFNSNTGVFQFTRNNGEIVEIDTALEKVPISAKIIEDLSGRAFLVITNIDGSETSTNVSKLLNRYNFTDTDEINVIGSFEYDDVSETVSLYKYKFSIKENSIKLNKLDAEVLDTFNAIKSDTEIYKNAAQISAENASHSEDIASQCKKEARESADDSYEYAIFSKSYAVGGTNTRTNENTDNTKYYYECTVDAKNNALREIDGKESDALSFIEITLNNGVEEINSQHNICLVRIKNQTDNSISEIKAQQALENTATTQEVLDYILGEGGVFTFVKTISDIEYVGNNILTQINEADIDIKNDINNAKETTSSDLHNLKNQSILEITESKQNVLNDIDIEKANSISEINSVKNVCNSSLYENKDESLNAILVQTQNSISEIKMQQALENTATTEEIYNYIIGGGVNG